ncbi:hypothetical protein L360_04931 [Enterobacter sp. MGH 14]|nr:hypothetical protein L360_04931 [Enterobacter sp. MGH 14]
MSLARNATASQSPTQTNGYERHQPDQTLLYQLVEQHYPAFKASLEAQGQHLPRYIQQEFNDLLQCGRLEYGFHAGSLRGLSITSVWSPSAVNDAAFALAAVPARMAESAALLIDEVFPKEPIRQWVLSFPFQLRFLLARHPQLMGPGLEYRLSYTLNSSDQKSRLHQSLCTNWLSDSYPTLWLRAKSQCPLPHAVSRWCLCRR